MTSSLCWDFILRIKGEVHPWTDREGPEVEEKFSFTLSHTAALGEVGLSTPRSGRFAPGNDPVPIV